MLTSGGVSVGDADVVKTVLRERCGGTMRWMQVAIRPAKPFAFGLLEASATPVFGLPGNPVSAMVSFELFVRPAVRRMAGHSVLERLTVPGHGGGTAGAPTRRQDALRPLGPVASTTRAPGGSGPWSDRSRTSCR